MRAQFAVGKQVLACAALVCALAAGIAAADGGARGQFAVWAIGLPDGYVIMEHQSPVLHVSAEDAARGTVEVQSGSHFTVTTRLPGRIVVEFYTRRGIFQAVRVDGMGRTVELSSMGGTIVQQNPVAGTHIVVFDYRFLLAPETAPGTYPWPLQVVVRSRSASDLLRLSEDRSKVRSVRADP